MKLGPGYRALTRLVVVASVGILLTGDLSALTSKKKKKTRANRSTVTQVSAVRRVHHRRAYRGLWTEPTYADSTNGDNVDGEDLVVRRAAAEALGPFNGSIVVVNPNSGRILTMVNQKLALGGG